MKYICTTPFRVETQVVNREVAHTIKKGSIWYGEDLSPYTNLQHFTYLLTSDKGDQIYIDIHLLLCYFSKVDDAYESVRIKLTERGVFGKEHILSFDYTGYMHFKQRFLRRFGNINTNRALKRDIMNTNSLNDLERVFSTNDNWKIKIMKERY